MSELFFPCSSFFQVNSRKLHPPPFINGGSFSNFPNLLFLNHPADPSAHVLFPSHLMDVPGAFAVISPLFPCFKSFPFLLLGSGTPSSGAELWSFFSPPPENRPSAARSGDGLCRCRHLFCVLLSLPLFFFFTQNQKT